ncbi:MAG: hypothetical protein RSD67_03755 [Oscillospiraceae bacterium]
MDYLKVDVCVLNQQGVILNNLAGYKRIKVQRKDEYMNCKTDIKIY